MFKEKSCSETDLSKQQELCDADVLQRSSMPSSESSADHSSITGPKPIEIPTDPWITSGPMESRDAVLVFRTDILNTQVDNISKKESVHKLDSSSNSSNIVRSIHAFDHNNQIIKNTSKIVLTLPTQDTTYNSNSNSNSNNSNNHIENHAGHTSPSYTFKFQSYSEENIDINNQQKFIQFDVKKRQRLKSSPKKRYLDSLSSSSSGDDDHSTSSGSEDNENSNVGGKRILPPSSIMTVNAAKIDHVTSRKSAYLKNNQNSKVETIPSHKKQLMAAVSAGTHTLPKPQVTTGNNNDDHNKENVKCTAISNVMPATKLNITYKFMNSETKLLKRIFTLHGLTEVEGEQNFNILWTGIHMKPDILRNLSPYQRVNHFPRSYELTRKDRLYKNIEKMQHLRGFKYFDIVPQSFMIPLEYRDLVTAHNKCRGPWIVKPAASSRGRGIFIVNSPDQIPCDEQVLVSKYIAEPLCIDGHKSDIRVYVLVTSFDPLIIYIYEEGLVRLAAVKYNRNAENLWNPCMHLCNYSINKYHSDYIKSSDAADEDVGHKWTLSALLRHLKNQGCDTNQLMLNIEDLIIKSIFSCAQSIVSACRMFVPSGNNCFELYGFDILIDDTLKPWLLEINLSPSLGIDSPLDAKVKASMMTDLLTLIGIPAYTPEMRANFDTKWSRFKNISHNRRSNSADPFNNNPIVGRKGVPGNLTSLTLEESKIVRNLKLQNSRRGGFVRIYPTEDSLQRYGAFLDTVTGIPISQSPNQAVFSIILPHNFNQMLFNQIYGANSKDALMRDNSFALRMQQYERVLELTTPIRILSKQSQPKCIEEGKKLRMKIRKLIESGNELTQHQARHAFGLYLELVLKRLTEEPKLLHEKIILKFVNCVGGTFKAPTFTRNTLNYRIVSKDRSAMVAKLLSDYLETYNHETEAYIDSFDNCGMIPISLFNEFLKHAQETDLESILALHTNVTHSMPFLYNRCSFSIPTTPPIPTGSYGFLKALPSMVPCYVRDNTKIDSYYKPAAAILDKSLTENNNKMASSMEKCDNNKKSLSDKLITNLQKTKNKAAASSKQSKSTKQAPTGITKTKKKTQNKR